MGIGGEPNVRMSLEIREDPDGLNIAGTVTLLVDVVPNPQNGVEFLVDGKRLALTTVKPYQSPWDTRTVPDGTHLLQANAIYRTRTSRTNLAVTVLNAVPPPPPPPPTGLLAWRPPGYQGGDPRNPANYPGFQVVHMNEQNRVFSGSGDLFVVAESTVTHPYFRGYRHVVAIGVDVDQSINNENGSDVHGCTGVIHFEGWNVHGTGLRDGLGLSTGGTSSSPGATIQLENYRSGPVHTFGDYHGDNVQLWGSSGSWRGGCGEFRVDRFTGITDLQALFLGNHDGALTGAEIRNANLIGRAPSGAGQLLYKHARLDPYGQSSLMTLENVWMQQISTDGSPLWTTPDNWVVPNAAGTYWGATPDPTRKALVGTDAQGQYVYWVDTADVKGQVRVGAPPAGDFVPASLVGLGYVSPGYQ